MFQTTVDQSQAAAFQGDLQLFLCIPRQKTLLFMIFQEQSIENKMIEHKVLLILLWMKEVKESSRYLESRTASTKHLHQTVNHHDPI
ncbi:hypothetical protein Ahy_A07g032901 isoform H [Arachis hypogaea]|uniref:Uncharacterized protein n=1 Tax=Arachis hypogaea TaxID=3818 RepID=A0A445C7Y2_ARAHY|nr:hypothetical protein Ahy_A07g032901 isoform H [Arachis hypogaea]